MAFQQKKADADLAEQRKAEKAARSYDTLFSNDDGDGDDADDDDFDYGGGGGKEKSKYANVREMEEDFM